MFAVLLVGGCAAPTEPAEPAPETEASTAATETEATAVELVGTQWACYEFAVGQTPQTVLADAPIYAEFTADGILTGNGGVNSYNTTYKVDGESMTIDGDIGTTKMAGSEEAMKQEADYLLTLPTAASYNLRGDELVLFGPAQNMIARYRPAQ